MGFDDGIIKFAAQRFVAEADAVLAEAGRGWQITVVKCDI